MRKAILSAGLLLCAVAGAGCDGRKSYYAPGEIPERDSANITVHRLGGHDEVSHRIPGGYFIDRVVDEWWEDGNEFRLFRGSEHIATMTEASSYWGYSQRGQLRIFFVDYPPHERAREGVTIKQPSYDYRLLTIGRARNEIHAFECTFRDFQLLRPDARSRAEEAQGHDAHPYLVSKYLAGAEARDRDCRPEPVDFK